MLPQRTSTAIARPLTGDPRLWVRDFTLLSVALAALPVLYFGANIGSWMALIISACAVLSGALVGWALPSALEQVRGRLSLISTTGVIASVGALVGAGLGYAAHGVEAAYASPYLIGGPDLANYMFSTAITVALMAATLWLPYTALRANRQGAWPIVALAALVTPIWWLTGILVAEVVFPSMPQIYLSPF